MNSQTRLRQVRPIYIHQPSISRPLQKVKNPKRIISRKIILVFTYLTCLILFLWQAGLCARRYLSYPIGTKRIAKEEKVTYMPSVSICNNYHRFRQTLQNKKENNSTSLTKVEIENMWKEYGIDQNNITIIRTCKEYNTKDKMFTSVMGRCIDITFGCPLFQKTIGMNIEVNEHLNIQNISGFTEVHAPYYNIYVHVTGEMDIRKIFKNVEGIWGSQLVIALEKRETLNLNSRTNPCISIEKHIKCRNKCAVQAFERNATCKIPTFEEANLPFCTSWKDVFKSYQLHDHWQVFEGKFDNCSCIRPCTQTEFKVDYVIKDKIEERILKLQLLIAGRLNEVVEEYYIYPLSVLISDLSGIIGFFLGVSLLSLFQSLHSFGVNVTSKLHK